MIYLILSIGQVKERNCKADMSDIEFLESWFNKVKKEKGIETAIEYLQIKERQKYNYYCTCSDRWTAEESEEYNKSWNWIINKLNEYKANTLTNEN